MKRAFERTFILSAILFWSAFCVPRLACAQQDEGEKLFKQSCTACHTINQGVRLGPDLVNIHNRRPEEWTVSFIKSSQSIIKSGDPYAVELFEKFNKMVMPDNNFTDPQILSIIQYIAANSPGESTGAAVSQCDCSSTDAPAQSVSEENIRSGQMLFNGKKRFTNNGPTCHSCHNIDRADVTAGGTLAKDLTNAHSGLGEAGVKAIIGNAPFPAMAKAYDGKPLTDQEVFDLAAFLQYVDRDSASNNGPYYGARLFFSGLGGAVVLFGLFAGVRTRSKKRCVNHEIYERQIKSTWEDSNK